MEEDRSIKKLMSDVQSEYLKSNKTKDKIIVLLIVLMFLEAAVFFGGFVWYESQFEYVETTEDAESVSLDTNGDNANIDYDYNNIDGNQYNDNVTHNEGGVD